MNIFLQVERDERAGIIADMPELDEMITVTQAVELADGRYTNHHIAHIARKGGFPGAVQVARVWLIPKSVFINWLGEERRPGPKTSD